MTSTEDLEGEKEVLLLGLLLALPLSVCVCEGLDRCIPWKEVDTSSKPSLLPLLLLRSLLLPLPPPLLLVYSLCCCVRSLVTMEDRL
jgi:hypothetical protein